MAGSAGPTKEALDPRGGAGVEPTISPAAGQHAVPRAHLDCAGVPILLAALLVLALIPAVAAANTSAWASRSVMDRATFTETVDHALDEPEAREYLAEQLAAAMFDALIDADERSRLILAPLAGQSPDAPRCGDRPGLEPRIEAALDHPADAAARLRLVEPRTTRWSDSTTPTARSGSRTTRSS